jgi:choline dehydrogenase-like flavoprotein
MHYIIGSGPAGVACAKALLARGRPVAMLDAGLQLEVGRAEVVGRMGGKKVSEWKPEERAAIQSRMDATASGIGLKLLFNSDFPYRETEQLIPWHGPGLGLRPSLAMGGLSNVWGAAMLPHRDEDIADWPVNNSDLASHYRAVAGFTGLAGQLDDLAEWYPLHCDRPHALQASEQAEILLRRLKRQRAGLRAGGWRFGRSRLAVRAADSPDGAGCVYCRECMGGCVYGCIYNSADTVRQLQADKNFSYRSDVIVKTVGECRGGVRIEGFDRRTGAGLSFEAERAYLAAGVIPTAQILLRSQSAFDRPLVLRDSQYFLLPLVLAKRARHVRTEALHTLSQLFVDICHPRISRHTVHLQIYSFSDLIGEAVAKSLGPAKFLAPQIEGRMVIIQGFLHSHESSTIAMTLKKQGENDCLELEARLNPETRLTVKRVVRELLKRSRALGGLVVPPMLQFAEPGRSFHNGGSVPMRTQPGEFECDTLGRPHGWSSLHVVDASVLPSIPATTITFAAMANAHRIGWETATL